MEIDRYLNQIRQSDDLSYSENAQQISVMQEEAGKKLIDEETLLRLVDECKDEESRLQIMNLPNDQVMNETKSQIATQNRLTDIELDAFDSVARRLEEASNLAKKQEQVVLQIQAEMRELEKPQLDFEQLALKQEKEIQITEHKLDAARKEVDKFKHKVGAVMEDMDQINCKLEKYDAMFTKLRDLQEKAEYELPQDELQQTKVEIEEDSDALKKIMADVAHYQEYVGLIEQRDRLLMEGASYNLKRLQ